MLEKSHVNINLKVLTGHKFSSIIEITRYPRLVKMKAKLQLALVEQNEVTFAAHKVFILCNRTT